MFSGSPSVHNHVTSLTPEIPWPACFVKVEAYVRSVSAETGRYIRRSVFHVHKPKFLYIYIFFFPCVFEFIGFLFQCTLYVYTIYIYTGRLVLRAYHVLSVTRARSCSGARAAGEGLWGRGIICRASRLGQRRENRCSEGARGNSLR